jgi:alcohol dehydrogenase, propanol-preferring
MRAIRLHAVGEPLRLEDVPMPEPSGAEVRVRVAGCGVCRTDLHIADGIQPRVRLPITLGHEIAGWVDAVGPHGPAALAREALAIGDAVVVHGGWGCGACEQCRAGEEQRCASGASPGLQRDGGYAEHIVVPHPRHLVALGSLDPVDAAPLADAGMTTYRAVQRAGPWLRSDARVLVIGLGALGQFALQHLRLLAAGPSFRVVAAEASPARAELATGLGANAGLYDPDAAAVTVALGGRADVAFDFVGADTTLALAADVVAPGGVVMLVGEAGGHLPFGFDVGRPPVEAWLTTTAWGSLADLRAVVALAVRGEIGIDVEPLPLADAALAHKRLRSGDVKGRIVVVPTAPTAD